MESALEKEQFERFLKRECAPEEEVAIIDWLQTPEGKRYLYERLESDQQHLESVRSNILVPRLDSEELFDRILDQTKSTGTRVEPQRKRWRETRIVDTTKVLIQVALLLLVFGTSGWLAKTQLDYEATQGKSPSRPEFFETGVGQQLDVRLSDGSRIRLNEESRLTIPAAFSEDHRIIALEGEAFFQVESDETAPFRIDMDGASVTVLGTEFNLHSGIGRNREVLVSVTKGLVELQRRTGGVVAQRRRLQAGEVGVLNRHSGLVSPIRVERNGVMNYLAWMNRRLQFKETPLSSVCRQFERIYEVECIFRDPVLGELKLTTDISEFSLDRTLTIIAMSLDLEVVRDGDRIHWLREEE